MCSEIKMETVVHVCCNFLQRGEFSCSYYRLLKQVKGKQNKKKGLNYFSFAHYIKLSNSVTMYIIHNFLWNGQFGFFLIC